MRGEFGHLLPLSAEELVATLSGRMPTVANVLVGLYRDCPETRDGLLRTLRNFEGRLPFSHQLKLAAPLHHTSAPHKDSQPSWELRTQLRGAAALKNDSQIINEHEVDNVKRVQDTRRTSK